MTFPPQSPPPRPPYVPYRPDPRVRELKKQVVVLAALVVAMPVALGCFLWFGLPFLNHLAAGEAHNDGGDKIVASNLLDQVDTRIDVPHTMGKVSMSTEVCNSVSRTDPAATFSTTAWATLKGVAPADHVTVTDEVTRAWPRLLRTYRAGSEWTVRVMWDSPTGTEGRITTHADCPPVTAGLG